MTSQAPSAISTQTNLNNPFLNQEDSTVYTSTVPAPYGAGAGAVSDPLQPTSYATSGSGTSIDATSGSATSGSGSLLDRTSTVTGSHAQHAGSLAPDESTIAPATVPEGTEHVSNLLTGIAGAVLSAPAAAFEALSPKAAAKTSDGVAFVQSKLPALSLQDATAKAQGLAGAAYNSVPEGTAATLQGYAGAAVGKAQEVLPPALGGSPTTGNTGTGELAKSPTQLAHEYGSAAQQTVANAANAAAAFVQQAFGSAKQTASDTAAAASQTASDLTNAASAKASDASAAASQTASDLSNQASATASAYTNSAKQTTADLSNKASATASDYSNSAQQTASDLSNRASATASDYSSSAQQTASGLSNKASATASDYSSSAQQTASDISNTGYDYTKYAQQSGADYTNRSAAIPPSDYSSSTATAGSTYPGPAQDSLEQLRTRQVPTGSVTQTTTGTSGGYEYIQSDLAAPKTTL